MIGGGVGGTSTRKGHADRSNSKNSSAVSCGVGAALSQPAGNGSSSPSETWMPVCTKRPHCSSGVATFSTGMLIEKYGIELGAVIQLCVNGVSSKLAAPSTLSSAMLPSVGDAPT